jgi:hypothetical protein
MFLCRKSPVILSPGGARAFSPVFDIFGKNHLFLCGDLTRATGHNLSGI